MTCIIETKTPKTCFAILLHILTDNMKIHRVGYTSSRLFVHVLYVIMSLNHI